MIPHSRKILPKYMLFIDTEMLKKKNTFIGRDGHDFDFKIKIMILFWF